jgi:glycosyltransferase involved in cell wall biosynthesis
LGDIASRIWKISSERVRHIPNGIVSRTSYENPITNLQLDLPSDLPRIAWVGALRPEKNPVRLLRAFSPLRGKAILLIVGGGPMLRTVRAEAERLGLMPWIRFLGQRTDARDIIMQCDVLALSSDTEQMPFAILEAMDAGLAVASVDVGDVRRMVAAENRQFIVPLNEQALGAALSELVANPALRADIGLANKRRLRECYDIRTMASRYAHLFCAVAAKPVREGLAHV